VGGRFTQLSAPVDPRLLRLITDRDRGGLGNETIRSKPSEIVAEAYAQCLQVASDISTTVATRFMAVVGTTGSLRRASRKWGRSRLRAHQVPVDLYATAG
jgi:hypothetical protein